MALDTSDFRNGMHMYLDGEVFTIIEFQHVKPGKGGAFVRTRLRNVKSGRTLEKTFRAGEKIEEDYYGSGLELRPTPSPHILRAELPAVDPSWIRSAVQELLDLAGTRKAEPLIEALARIIPDYHRTSSADAAGGS